LRTWGAHRLIESQNVQYHEQLAKPRRTLSYEIVLTETGHRAMKLALLDSVHWMNGKIDIRASNRALRQKIEMCELHRDFTNAVLATDEKWLEEAREAVMMEIMKRNLIDNMFVYPPERVYV
jgi:hypothetical protein